MTVNRLYRGVDIQLYEKLAGELKPKLEKVFSRVPTYGHDEYGNCFYGNTPSNEVIEHQRNQAGIPTSGVSFTPHIERARYYATRGGKLEGGYIYVIDKKKCSDLGVALYVVNELVPQPSIPEDDEVILVAQDYGNLPKEIIVEIIENN